MTYEGRCQIPAMQWFFLKHSRSWIITFLFKVEWVFFFVFVPLIFSYTIYQDFIVWNLSAHFFFSSSSSDFMQNDFVFSTQDWLVVTSSQVQLIFSLCPTFCLFVEISMSARNFPLVLMNDKDISHFRTERKKRKDYFYQTISSSF